MSNDNEILFAVVILAAILDVIIALVVIAGAIIVTVNFLHVFGLV